MCKYNTGIQQIASYIANMYDTDLRTRLQALAIYLFWLKTGLSQRQIASHFEVDSHFDIFRYLKQVRTALIKNFVSKFLGFDHLDRDEWVKKNTKMAREFFVIDGNPLIIICDGT
jgi:hypothetical protein